MTEMKIYWCEDKPTLEDIEQAFAEVSKGFVVEIKWKVYYSGFYSRIITPFIVETNRPEDYLNEFIPHRYSV